MATVAIMLLTACGSSPARSTATPRATEGSATTPATASLKPTIHGLMDRDGPPPERFAAAVTSFVVNAPWSELQPTPGGPLSRDNVIDTAVAQARTLSTRGHDVGVKIRLLGGIDAPEWAKELGGAPLRVNDPA